MAKTYRWTDPSTGVTATRRSEADYTHVSVREGEVKWHGSQTAAERRTGARVHSLQEFEGAVAARAPADEGATCTIGPTAVEGTRCGAPAVTSFTGPSGKRYHECEGHVCG